MCPPNGLLFGPASANVFKIPPLPCSTWLPKVIKQSQVANILPCVNCKKNWFETCFWTSQTLFMSIFMISWFTDVHSSKEALDENYAYKQNLANHMSKAHGTKQKITEDNGIDNSLDILGQYETN